MGWNWVGGVELGGWGGTGWVGWNWVGEWGGWVSGCN